MSASLSVKVNIADEDLVYLRQNGFNFCLSRDVLFEGQSKKGNVVFAAVPSKFLSPRIGVQWKDDYQVYETSQFEAGAAVKICTDVCNIVGDQEATVHEDGVVTISGGYGPGAPFRVDNQWKDQARVGVSNYNVRSDTYSSFFVSPKVEKPSTISILPMQLYAVFWDKKLAADTVFHPSSVDRYLFALTPGTAEVTLTYKDKEWSMAPPE